MCGVMSVDICNLKCDPTTSLTINTNYVSVQSLQPRAENTATTAANERLVKAKSDGSISSSNPTTDNSAVLSKLKSKSLEPLTGEQRIHQRHPFVHWRMFVIRSGDVD